jgi:hypothetical protein
MCFVRTPRISLVTTGIFGIIGLRHRSRFDFAHDYKTTDVGPGPILCRQQDWLACGDHHGVLVMSGGRAVRRANRPTVLVHDDPACARGDDGLNGKHHAILQNLALADLTK